MRQIFVLGDISEAARAAAANFDGPRILCGELNCLRPAGFDLGNSPVEWSMAAHSGRTAIMATTNGTRAILAAAACKTGSPVRWRPRQRPRPRASSSGNRKEHHAIMFGNRRRNFP